MVRIVENQLLVAEERYFLNPTHNKKRKPAPRQMLGAGCVSGAKLSELGLKINCCLANELHELEVASELRLVAG